MKNQTVSKIAVASLVIILLAVFSFAIYSYNVNKAIKDSNDWVVHTNKVLYKSEKVISVLKDIETATRGFVITGDSDFLRPYFLSKDSISINIRDLKKLTADNNIQQTRIKTLEELANRRLQICKDVQQIRNDNNYTLDSIKPLIAEGKKIMDEIRDTFKYIQQEENRLLVVREDKNKENLQESEISFFILFGSIVVLLITTFVANRFFARLRKKDSNALLQLDTKLIFFGKRIDDIVKGISDPFFALNKDFAFMYYNDAVQRSIGQGKGSLTGKNIFDTFPQYKENITGDKIKEVMLTKQSTTFEAYEDFLDQWQDITIYPTSEGVSVYIKDATRRKAYEAQLQTTRQLLDATNEVALIGGWDVDMASGKVNWTTVTRIIHETDASYEPDLKKSIAFYKEGKSRDKITQLINNAIEHHNEWDAELQIVTAKGNEKWIRTKGKPEFENGECVRLIGTCQDIDIQKKLNDQLLRSEQQFKSAFDNSLDGMSLIDVVSGEVEINPAFSDITGYTKEEFAALGFEKMTHPDDREKDKETYRQLVNGNIKKWRYEKRYIHKEGHVIWAEASGSAITNAENDIINFVAQMQDITQKKITEEKFIKERNLLRTIIDNLPLNVYIKDIKSRKTLVNKTELEYMGAASESEVLGKDDFELYPHQYALISVAEDKYVFATGKPILNRETKSVKKDGTETLFLTSKIPLFNDKKEVTGLVGISYDISAISKSATKK